PRRPGCRESRSASSSFSVLPLPSTDFAPPVYERRMVGIRTSTDMTAPDRVRVWGRFRRVRRAGQDERRRSGATLVLEPRRGVPELVRLHRSLVRGAEDPHRLLGDHPVHDAERPDLRDLRVAGGDEQVVGAWLSGQVDVGARRVRLGGGVRVVDHHRLLVALLHLPPDPQLLHRVEPVEGGRTLRILHRDVSRGRVRTGGARDHAARLVRVVPAGVGDDRRDDLLADAQHGLQPTCFQKRPIVHRRRPGLTPPGPQFWRNCGLMRAGGRSFGKTETKAHAAGLARRRYLPVVSPEGQQRTDRSEGSAMETTGSAMDTAVAGSPSGGNHTRMRISKSAARTRYLTPPNRKSGRTSHGPDLPSWTSVVVRWAGSWNETSTVPSASGRVDTCAGSGNTSLTAV